MSTEIEVVQFRDEQLEGIRGGDGKPYAVVSRICRNLGVNSRAQVKKLLKAPWSGAVLMAAPDSRGSLQEHLVIPIDSIPQWLVTIREGAVSEAIRPKLRLYQKEARDVLARHFMPQMAQILQHPAVADVPPGGGGVAESLTLARQSIQALQALYSGLEAVNHDLMIIQHENRDIVSRQAAMLDENRDIVSRQAAMSERLEQIARPIEVANQALRQLPSSPISARPFTVRQQINARHQLWCKANGVEYQEKWGQIYDHFRRRYSIDVGARHRNNPEKYRCKLDVVEDLGMLEDLLALVCELCPGADAKAV